MSFHTIGILTIPLFTAVIGYVTNWTGVWMLFNPVKFAGFRLPGLRALAQILPRRIQQVPGMTVLSAGAESAGLDQAFAFALVNLTWAGAQTAGAGGGGALAESAGDWAAYGAVATVMACALLVSLRASPARACR